MQVEGALESMPPFFKDKIQKLAVSPPLRVHWQNFRASLSCKEFLKVQTSFRIGMQPLKLRSSIAKEGGEGAMCSEGHLLLPAPSRPTNLHELGQ